MNIKSILLTAVVASMTLVACDSSDESDVLSQDKMPKSVTITLPNITQTPGSRATGKGMEAGQIGLKNFKVFFLDGAGECINDEVPTTAQLGGKDTGLEQAPFYFDANLTNYVGASNKITYHFLPAKVSKVVVVGNIDDVEYSAVNADFEIKNDGAEGEGVLDANNHPYYPLYGESGLTMSTAKDDKAHDNVYTASVNLAPRVSRLEIYGFEYKSDASGTFTYESVQPVKLALANYVGKYNLSTGSVNADTKVVAPTDPSLVWDWITNADAPWADSFSTTVSLAQNAKMYVDFTNVPDDDNDGSKFNSNMITYSVAKSATKADNPELLLTLYGVGANGAKTPHYLYGKFQGDNHPVFDAGKIYRVLFPITDGAWDNPDRCVELTVTVANWTIEVVTPEF